jgi:hypothetical protein
VGEGLWGLGGVDGGVRGGAHAPLLPSSNPSAPAPVLPARLVLTPPLRTLLSSLAASIASAQPAETRAGAAACLNALEEKPFSVYTDSPDAAAVGAGVEGGSGLPGRTAEEAAMAAALAVGGVAASPFAAPPPASPSAPPSLPLRPLPWLTSLLVTLAHARALSVAPLYALAPMHPAWASCGWEPESEAIMNSIAATCDPAAASGRAAGPKAGDYTWSGPGGLYASSSSSDGGMSGLLPTATLASVLTPRPWDMVIDLPGVDTALAGCCRLAAALAEADPVAAGEVGGETGGLVHAVYSRLLFGQGREEERAEGPPALPLVRLPPGGPPAPASIALSPPTRRAAFALLRALTRRSPAATRALLSALTAQAAYLWDSSPRLPDTYANEYRLEPGSNVVRSPTGYVGLRNLGATCYMNSLLQQFYGVEALRYGVLATVDAGEEGVTRFAAEQPELAPLISRRAALLPKLTAPDKGGKPGEAEAGGVPPSDIVLAFRGSELRRESMLYQVQRIFGALELSGRKAWDYGMAWLHAYKDGDGRASSPIVQQDAQEFLGTFLDRLEYALAGTPRAGLVNTCLGMSFRELKECTGGCGTTRSVGIPSSPWWTLEVGPGCLPASLTGYTAWEEVSDYECEACAKRTTLRKRATLESTSDTLIIHLKRFEMNYENGITSKINSRFAFPHEVDLWPYSFEALSGGSAPDAPTRSKWAYALVGIVVHMGALDSGHYFSFMKERGARGRAAAEARAAVALGLRGGPAEVAAEVARASSPGGTWHEFNDSSVTPWDPAEMEAACFGGDDSGTSPVVRSAYMLVYERVSPCSPLAAGGLTAPDLSVDAVALAEAEAADRALAAALEVAPPWPGVAVVAPASPPVSPVGAGTAKRQKREESPRPRLRNGEGVGPLPASIVAEQVRDTRNAELSSGLCDREMGSLLLGLADGLARQEGLVPGIRSLPPLPAPLPPLDGDGSAPGGPVPSMRGLLSLTVGPFLRSSYGMERTPAPPAPTLLHAVARVVGASPASVATSLVEDVVVAEELNENAYSFVAEATVLGRMSRMDPRVPCVPLPMYPLSPMPMPPLTGRMPCPSPSDPSLFPPFAIGFYGWLRPALAHQLCPAARVSAGRLLSTALLRIALPTATIVAAQELWAPDRKAGESRRASLARMRASIAGVAGGEEAWRTATLVGKALRVLAAPSLHETLALRFFYAEAYWTTAYDILRGGFGAGLPLPLPPPPDALGVAPLDWPAVEGCAEAAGAWASGVTLHDALPPSFTTALPPAADSYRTTAYATARLRHSWSAGRSDLRAATIAWLGQFDAEDLDCEPHRLAMWAPPPGTLLKTSPSFTSNSRFARLSRAWDAAALMSRCAPPLKATEHPTGLPPTWVGVTPIPPAVHTAAGLLALLERAVAAGVGGAEPVAGAGADDADMEGGGGGGAPDLDALLRRLRGGPHGLKRAMTAMCERWRDLSVPRSKRTLTVLSAELLHPSAGPSPPFPALASLLPVHCPADVSTLSGAATRAFIALTLLKSEVPSTAALEASFAGASLPKDWLELCAALASYDERIKEAAAEGGAVPMPPPAAALISDVGQDLEKSRLSVTEQRQLNMLRQLDFIYSRLDTHGLIRQSARAIAEGEATLLHLAVVGERNSDRQVPFPFGHNMEAAALLFAHREGTGRPDTETEDNVLYGMCSGEEAELDAEGWAACAMAEAVGEVGDATVKRDIAQRASADAVAGFMDCAKRLWNEWWKLRAAPKLASRARETAGKVTARLHCAVRLAALGGAAYAELMHRQKDGSTNGAWMVFFLWELVVAELQGDASGWVVGAEWNYHEGAPPQEGDGGKPRSSPAATSSNATLPAWALAALDPDNTILLLPPSLLPAPAAIAASRAATPASSWRGPLLATLAGPVTALSVRDDAVAVREATDGRTGLRAAVVLTRLLQMMEGEGLSAHLKRQETSAKK